LFEVGNENTRDEAAIGYKSNLLGDKYTGLQNGRFFGLGGASARWGGQLLMFSSKDFSAPSTFMRDIIEVDQKYKKTVFEQFGIVPDFDEPSVSAGLFIKTGVWLGYFSRNLFKHFRVGRRTNVTIIPGARVLRMILGEKKTIKGVQYLYNGKTEEAHNFDFYFLAAGAFESVRILLSSDALLVKKVPFSDHLSQRVFRVVAPTKIGEHDFAFKVKGTSLVTKRLIGEVDGVSFFANPIYNANFVFFQNLKKVMFKHELSFRNIISILKDLPSCFAFAWSVLIRREIMVHKNEWDIYIDIENPDTKSHVSLSQELDRYGVPALDVEFHIGERAEMIYNEAKKQVRDYLIANNVPFEECCDRIQVEKSEDTYHPYGMLSEFKSLNDYYLFFPNMLVVNTGVLPRAGGINSTASLFPVIEDYVARAMR